MSKNSKKTVKSVRKMHRGEILGYSITAMIRAMAVLEFTVEETERVVHHYGHKKTSRGTIMTQRSRGMHAAEQGLTMPKLSRKELKELRAAAVEQMA